MEFIWGFLLGVFATAFVLSRKFRAGVWAVLKGLGRGFMSFRQWARTHGPYAESTKRRKSK